ncbi:pyridoxamine 5'-phosphate oxidase family protein [Chloroflexota bacterium]
MTDGERGFRIAALVDKEIPREIRRCNMAKMPKEVMDLLNERPLTPKVLATCDATGTLNVVPKETLSAVDEETIAFADIWGNKTNVNLKANSNVAVTVFKVEVPPVGY